MIEFTVFVALVGLFAGWPWAGTKKRRALQALGQGGEWSRLLLDNVSDLLLVVDQKRRIRYAGPAAGLFLGTPPPELAGRDLLELFHPDDHAAAVDAVERALATPGAPQSLEHRLRRADGSWRTFESVGQSLSGGPGDSAAVIVARDVTDRRKLERELLQAQRMEALGRLAGGVAHDFNNLLTAILGFSELLLRVTPETDSRRAHLEEIRKAGVRAAGLTRQLLAFSRRQVVQPQALNLNRVVADLLSMLKRLLGEDVELTTHLSPALWRTRADAGQLEQVIVNLTVNARDAMPSGGRLLIATSNHVLAPGELGEYQSAGGEFVLLEVSDTGVGMDAETLAHAFHPFFTTKPAGTGTGLGLATVYSIVKQSAGFATAASTPGEGTSLRVYLPRTLETVRVPSSATVVAGAAKAAGTVLVVEDEGVVRSLVGSILTTAGFRVLAAENAEEALAIAAREGERIDLLLTDVVMPGKSGPQLAEELQRRLPRLSVLFVSGYTDDALARHSLAEPGHLLLAKPFTPNELLRRVREVLGAAPHPGPGDAGGGA